MKSNRRTFLELAGCSMAALSIPACQPASNEPPLGQLDAALRELNEAAGIGVTSDEYDRARAYVTGVYEAARATLRPMVFREDLEMAVHFSPRTSLDANAK
jgi:hypothetical protein